MWKVALGIAVLLQAGATRAAEEESKDSPAEPADEDRTISDDLPTEAPPATMPAPAAVAVRAPTSSAFATVKFRNDVDKKLRLVEAEFTMDGEKLPVVLNNAEPGKSYVIVSGAVKPGPHVVTARLTYQGDRRVFSYMKGYKLNVRSDQVLTTPPDRTVSFTVVGREAKGMTVPLDKRVVINVEDGATQK